MTTDSATPTSAYVSIGAAAVGLAFLPAPNVFAVFSVAACVVAVVAGWVDREPWQAKVGMTVGAVFGTLVAATMIFV